MKDAKPTLGVMLHITPQTGQSPHATYQAYTDLLIEAEALGYQSAWVTEHHFTEHSLSPAPLLLMGHFLAHTQHLTMGAAAVLAGFHNPIVIAEQLATLEAIYPGRVDCGFAKGGPFVSQNQAFQVDKDLSRARMEEGIPAIMALLNQSQATHQGAHYQWESLRLSPKVGLVSGRVFLATGHDSTIEMAAQNGFGLMAAQFWSVDKIATHIATYRDHHPSGQPPKMMAARGLFLDQDRARAREKALAFIETFRAQKAQLWDRARTPMQSMDSDALLDRMLCGTEDEVKSQVNQLLEAGVTHLGLNPLTSDHSTRLEQLAWFKRSVWAEAV